MTEKRFCDFCGKEIDRGQPFWKANYENVSNTLMGFQIPAPVHICIECVQSARIMVKE